MAESTASPLPANRLRELRLERNVTIDEIARAAGVYGSTVCRWQDRVIPQHQLACVADLLGVPVPYLAGWSDTLSSERAA